MPNPPCKRLINPDELFGSRDLRLQDRDDSQYQLLRHLCTGFDFSVLQLQRKIFSHLSRKMVPDTVEFVLATRDEFNHYWYSMTPGFANLSLLNDYVKHYEVDILHLHLFGEDDTDLYQLTDNNLY